MHVRALASSRSTVRKHRGFMVPSGPVTRPCSAEEPEQKLPGGHSAARSLAAPTLLPGRGSKRLNLDQVISMFPGKFVLNLRVLYLVLYMPVTA